ncbi:ABC transporter ATP-binding protein [Microbacterium sp. NC79]|uniref:ABC transporter ATP-binding protein n=1 Tax=Microbacterium sp. NC79 TaxID=2851009 RepID=UPI001C2BD193|nr:ATP-binding cassette domain-containing protein [Microbacterium sp. NC79]MBV0896221.1 ATP-binding cassette domain-containing protein [Microbacterium sp. NC79]
MTSPLVSVPTAAAASAGPVVSVTGVSKTFRRSGAPKRAVSNVSFDIFAGQTLGVVGESGSGKSTLSQIVLGLLRPDEGRVMFDGIDIWEQNHRAMRKLRSRIQVVFQDPHTSLNRRHDIRQIIEAPLRAHGWGNADSRRQRVDELLDLVRIPAALVSRTPTQLSGGQAQRVAIARALALSPSFIVLDEAVSALDTSVRASVLNLLADLQANLGLTYLFISHDLSVVRQSCHRVAVMRQGEFVEQADRDTLFNNPQHPYTRELLDAVPSVRPYPPAHVDSE